MIMGAIWLLGESNLRQLFLPYASAIAALCFVMILFCPVPILFYVDTILCGRYHRLYQIIGYIATGNLFVCSFLHMFGILDYIQTLPLGHLVLVATLAVVLVTTIRTLRHSTDKADRLVLRQYSSVDFYHGSHRNDRYLLCGNPFPAFSSASVC